MSRRQCKCCKPACERCASTWQQSTYTINGFSSTSSFHQWWWIYSPFGPPGEKFYFNTPFQESRTFCSEFDLTELNGTYVLEPYTNVGTDTSSGFFNACRGRYRKTILPTLVEKSCPYGYHYDKSGDSEGNEYVWDAYIQIDRNTFFTNGEKITFSMTQYLNTVGSTFDLWTWGFSFEILNDAACCASTNGTYGFKGFGWGDPGNIGGRPFGFGGGGKANFTPTVQITRTFRTTPSDCRYARVTESGDDLITETSDYLVLE